jgi:outer membrane receptor for ferrienterochelin and colicin
LHLRRNAGINKSGSFFNLFQVSQSLHEKNEGIFWKKPLIYLRNEILSYCWLLCSLLEPARQPFRCDGKRSTQANKATSVTLHRCAAMSFALLWLGSLSVVYPQTLSVSGTVRDGSTNELLPFANISVTGLSIGAVTDPTGYYRLPLKAGSHELVISFVGYKTETRRVQIVDRDTILHIKLFATDILLQEVTVYSSAPGQAVQTEVSSLSLPSERLVEVTSVIPDVFRSIQSLPGISADNEFSAKFSVRGGTYDENLVLVNGAQVYEPFHVKEAPNASISIFNIDMMQKVTLVTGGFSAKYGDRMSSVMDIQYREGSRDRLKGIATISMTNVDALLEGPLTPDISFIIGGRKSYVEYAMKFLNVDPDVHPSFYDVQGVLTCSLSSRDKLQFEFIHAGDTFLLDPSTTPSGPFDYTGQYKGRAATFHEFSNYYEEQNARYVSNLFDLQSMNILGSSAFLRSELSYYEQIEEAYGYNSSDYSKDIFSTTNYFYRSKQEHLSSNDLKIRTLEAKSALDLQATPWYELNLGFSYQTIFYDQQLLDRRPFSESTNTIQYPDTTNNYRVDSSVDASNEHIAARSFKFASYLEHVFQLSDALILNVGGRMDYFDFNKDLSVSPRFNLSYRFLDQTTLRAAWGLFYQSPIYSELAYSVACDSNTKGQRATHYILGVERAIPFDPLTTSSLTMKIEGYYKRYDQLISSTRTSSGRINYSRKNDATGWARGVDVYVALNLSSFYGWLSYGFLESHEDLLQDKIGDYPRYTDQRHTISFVGDWNLGSSWGSNVRVQYGSGYAYTPSSAVYNSKTNQWSWVQGDKNSGTLPPYRRVDIRISKEFELWSLRTQAYFDVSNLFNFTNIQSYRYRFNSNGNPYVEEVKLWPILPSLGMTVKF